jgi:hypothetical protein
MAVGVKAHNVRNGTIRLGLVGNIMRAVHGSHDLQIQSVIANWVLVREAPRTSATASDLMNPLVIISEMRASFVEPP